MQTDKTEPDEIKRICLQLLSGREHSRFELLQKLTAKGYAKDVINGVLQELAQHGWQSDIRFAECFCRQRINKGYGPLRINNELRQRGIDEFQLGKFIEEMELNWLDLIERLYRKKYTAIPTMSHKEWAKRTRFLLQRGFTFEIIQALFNRLAIKLEV